MRQLALGSKNLTNLFQKLIRKAPQHTEHTKALHYLFGSFYTATFIPAKQ